MKPYLRQSLIDAEACAALAAELEARSVAVTRSPEAEGRDVLALLLAWRLDLTTAEAVLALSGAPRGMDTGQAMTWR